LVDLLFRREVANAEGGFDEDAVCEIRREPPASSSSCPSLLLLRTLLLPARTSSSYVTVFGAWLCSEPGSFKFPIDEKDGTGGISGANVGDVLDGDGMGVGEVILTAGASRAEVISMVFG